MRQTDRKRVLDYRCEFNSRWIRRWWGVQWVAFPFTLLCSIFVDGNGGLFGIEGWMITVAILTISGVGALESAVLVVLHPQGWIWALFLLAFYIALYVPLVLP